MKKLFATAVLALGVLPAMAYTTLSVKGVEYRVDTLFHAKVGPGTTQTSLRLTASSYPLMVHYLTVDKSTPGVSLRSVCATDKLAGTARTSTMAASKTKPGTDYFCGVNADFFVTSGTAANGASRVGIPTTTCIVDGEIYKSSNSAYQFVVDTAGVASICRLNYYEGLAKTGDKVTRLKGFNVAPPSSGLTIYTERWTGTSNNPDYANASWEVQARLADGSAPLKAGGKFSLVVTSEPNAEGNTTIPAGGYVLHGRGTALSSAINTNALEFVKALKPGNVVEFDNVILTPEGKTIVPYTAVSGNPKNVGGGLTLDTESERGDAVDRHPRTNIGISASGDSIIMMVIDGRYTESAGVATSMAADIMRFAGAYESVNLDGGGSSTLYTHALGVRNHCSDGSERAVGNAIFAVLEAPEDTEIAELQFVDWSMNMPQYGNYRPLIYGYNRHGKLINTNVTGFTLSMPGGRPSADGMGITALEAGCHALTATLGGVSTSIAVNVAPLSTTPTMRLPEAIVDDAHPYSVEVQTLVADKTMALENNAFQWTSADASLATVDAAGNVQAVGNGLTTVTATLAEHSATLPVRVQIPSKRWMPIDPERNVESYAISKVGLSEASVEKVDADVLRFNYTVSATRGTRLTVKPSANLYAVPDSVRLAIDLGDAKVTKFQLETTAPGQRPATYTVDITWQPGVNVITIPVSELADSADRASFPLNLTSLIFYLGDSVGAKRSITVNAMQTVHNQRDASTNGISAVTADSTGDTRLYDLQGRPTDARTPGLKVSRNGKHLQR